MAEGCDKLAPYGLRLPGALSKLPEDKRAAFWHCAEHEANANRWRNRVMADLGMTMARAEP